MGQKGGLPIGRSVDSPIRSLSDFRRVWGELGGGRRGQKSVFRSRALWIGMRASQMGWASWALSRGMSSQMPISRAMPRTCCVGKFWKMKVSFQLRSDETCVVQALKRLLWGGGEGRRVG